MKRTHLSLLAVCTAAAALLSGCAQHHTHQFPDTWQTTLEQHWKICAGCGETAEESAHTLDDSNTCTVCGAQIVDWGDKMSLYQFKENGDPLKLADYSTDGTLITETIYTYEYDAQGNLTASTTVTDGVLEEESTYTLTNGRNVISQTVSYIADGGKLVNDFDEYGNSIRMISYDPEGNVELQEDSQYAQDAQGQWYEAGCTTIEKDGTKIVSEYSAQGDQTLSILYDAEGNTLSRDSWKYTYDENGSWKTMEHYKEDALVCHTVYATATDESGSVTYPETETEYFEDGSKTVTVYDEGGNVLSKTAYDANGNAIS